MILLPVILALILFAFLGLCWYYTYGLMHPKRQAACLLPSQVNVHAVPVSFPARDGICLRGWWIPARHPRGTIVLCHGYSGDCSPDLEYAPWLTHNGYNLLYFDCRGHGRSDGNFTTLGYYETRDLLGALDFLKSRGITSVGVLGFSMGGAVALLTGPMTDAIRCIVADCTFASLRTLITHHAPAAHVPSWLAPLGSTVVVAFASFVSRANLFKHTPVNSISRFAPRPVLIIRAGKDHLVPASESERLYEAARGPKELWVVEEAEHRLVDKLIREEYEQRVLAFFDRYLGTTPPEAEAEQPISVTLPLGQTIRVTN